MSFSLTFNSLSNASKHLINESEERILPIINQSKNISQHLYQQVDSCPFFPGSEKTRVFGLLNFSCAFLFFIVQY